MNRTISVFKEHQHSVSKGLELLPAEHLYQSFGPNLELIYLVNNFSYVYHCAYLTVLKVGTVFYLSSVLKVQSS